VSIWGKGSAAIITIAMTACSGSDSNAPPTESPDATTTGSSDASLSVVSDAPTAACVEETYPQGACDHRQYCRPASGYACCYCVPANASCGVAMAWICGDLYKDCPPSPPTPGSPCDMTFPNLGCTYCDPPLGAYSCTDKTWHKVLDELYCQSPLVRD
jgi:hypothetical protein